MYLLYASRGLALDFCGDQFQLGVLCIIQGENPLVSLVVDVIWVLVGKRKYQLVSGGSFNSVMLII